jgi:hypothetical protein
MKLILTKDDAERALTFVCDACLIARALKRVFPGREIKVEVKFYKIGDMFFPTTPAINRIVDAFDRGLDLVYPIELEIDVGNFQPHSDGEALYTG